MQITDKSFSLPHPSRTFLTSFFKKHDRDESFCFFDIETTGLSPKVSSVYLIGALWYDGQNPDLVHTRQWFADDYISEKDILVSFSEFLSDFTTLVHYNGSGFDIPYIEKKCAEFEIPSPFLSVTSLDIYKEIRKYKSLFGVPNLKLFTVEKRAGFMRTDVLTGKDCIRIYSSFMQKKYFRDDTMNTEQQKLLLHNREDIIGTCLCTRLLSYTVPGSFVSLIETEDYVTAVFSTEAEYPFPASEHKSPFLIEYHDFQVSLRLPVIRGTLRHFFKNYKDYYYLPAEDTAIHKSVGAYVDKEFREQAKASTCYVRKEGTFFAVPAGLAENDRTLFRTEYKSGTAYVLLDKKSRHDSSLMEEVLNLLL